MMKSNLFQDLMTIHNSFEKAFDRFFEGNWSRSNVINAADGAWIPAAEAFVKDEVLTIRVALPGVDEKHVSLTLTDNVLTITGERTPNAAENVRILLAELPYGRFERKIALPEEVLTD